MRQLKYLKIAKELRSANKKVQSDYGRDIDKYKKQISLNGKFEAYYGSYGSSSVYEIREFSNTDTSINQKVINTFLNDHFDELVELIALAHEKEAMKDRDSLIKQKEQIEEVLTLLDG